MDHALREVWHRGCSKVMLLTGSTQASTHACYRSCGFTPDVKTGYVARRLLPDERERAVSRPDPGAVAAATDR